ncbi:MAG: VOC family protein, partial [Kordiimonadaceae bacterium]|nr:VOC family protein [Kordiimonadaceae bacterium]
KVYADEDLDIFEKRLNDMGVTTSAVAAGEQPSVGRRVRFETPTGHVFDLYAEMALSENGPMVTNPDLWREEPKAMRIQRFDHCALVGINIVGAANIFTEALDFTVTERAIIPDNGEPVAIFLTCSNKAHDVAFLGNPENDGKLHHVSFNLESWTDIGHAADLISRYNISLDIGPTRHGITQGQTIYFFDPSGNRNETFAGGYSHYPDNPMREWTVDQMGKAIFYYEKEVHGRFVEVFT